MVNPERQTPDRKQPVGCARAPSSEAKSYSH